MEKYYAIIRSRRRWAILFTLVFLVGIGMLVVKHVADIDIPMIPGIALTAVGFYLCPLFWASTQNGRVVDEAVVKAVCNENKLSFNELRAYFGGNTDKTIKKVEWLAKKGCFEKYIYDPTFGLREKDASGKAIIEKEVIDTHPEGEGRVNLAVCQNCGATAVGESNECPYCGAKK